MKNKNIFLAVAVFFISALLNAAPITRSQAEKNLSAFLYGKSNLKFSRGPLKLASAAADYEPYYIYNVGTNEGFVILSGDDAAFAVLGYSDKGHIDTDNMPENMKAWLDGYKQAITELQKKNLPARRMNASSRNWAAISPMLTCLWDQGSPYNDDCPYYNGKCITGCVATAIAQVMYYHKWPVRSNKVPGYELERKDSNGNLVYTIKEEELPPVMFEWEYMKDNYEYHFGTRERKAVAQLMRYVGQSVKMNYGPGGSGAFSEDIADAMINCFGYDKGTHLVYRDVYEKEHGTDNMYYAWEKFMYDELATGRPIIYGGDAEEVGHQFVCDGYDGNGLFHINWGWSGHSNGYFRLEICDPKDQGAGGGSSGTAFRLNQSGIFGVRKPDFAGVFKAEKINMEPQTWRSFDISLASDLANKTSLQFDIEFPNDVVFGLYENGDAMVFMNMNCSESGDHVINSSRISEGHYRFVIYSPTNSKLINTTQPLLNITVHSSELSAEGDFFALISNAVICNTSLERFDIEDSKICISMGPKKESEKGTVTSEDMTIKAGLTEPMKMMFNTNVITDVKSIQFDLVLPKGISVEKNEDGTPKAILNRERFSDHTITIKELPDNSYRFFISSPIHNEIKGNSGEMVTLSLAATTDVPEGTYDCIIRDILACRKNLIIHKLQTEHFNITVNAEKQVLNISSTGGGSVTYGENVITNTSQAFKANKNSDVSLKITPDEGNYIQSLTLNGNDVTANIADNVYSFKITADTDVKATFEKFQYAMNIAVGEGGKVSFGENVISSGNQTFNLKHGDKISLSFIPDEGHKIKSVTVNGSDVTAKLADNTYVFELKGKTDIEVTFEKMSYAMDIAVGEGGKVTFGENVVSMGNKTFDVYYGDNVVLSIVPDESFKIKSLLVNGNDVTAAIADSAYTFTLKEKTDIKVTFEKIVCTMNVAVNEGGKVTFGESTISNAEQTFNVNHSDKVSLTFTPEEGNEVKSLVVNGSDVTASVENNTYTFTIKEMTDVKVTFGKKIYTMNITVGEHGEVVYGENVIKTGSSTFNVTHGENVCLTLNAELNYEVGSVTLNGKDVTNSTFIDIYTFTATEDAEIMVTFDRETLKMSVNISTDNGYVTIGENVLKKGYKTLEAKYGDTLTINFYPDEGYMVDVFLRNYQDITDEIKDNTYTFILTDESVYNVSFKKSTYAMNITCNEGGKVTYNDNVTDNGSNTYTVTHGDEVTLNIVPYDGYVVKSVSVNDQDVTAAVVNDAYTFTMKEKTDVKVEFEKIAFALNITAGEGGSVSFDGTAVSNGNRYFNVNYGDRIYLDITPDRGYVIKSVLVNDQDVTADMADNVYIFTMYENTDVKVTFERIELSLNIAVNEGGNVNYSGNVISEERSSFSVKYGDEISLTFTAYEGFEIKSVLVNNKDVTDEIVNDIYSMTLEENTDIKVTFKRSVPAGIESVLCNGDIKVSKKNGMIFVEGIESGTMIKVYTIGGALAASEKADGNTCTIYAEPSKVYIVKIGNKLFKIAL